MHMFIKQLVPRTTCSGWFRKSLFTINQKDPFTLLPRGNAPNQIVEFAVATEPQCVQITRRGKMFLRVRASRGVQRAQALPETKLGKLIIKLSRLCELRRRLAILAGLLERSSPLIELIPFGRFCLR